MSNFSVSRAVSHFFDFERKMRQMRHYIGCFAVSHFCVFWRQILLGKERCLENKKGEKGGNLSISEVETVEMVSNIWKDSS
jgi:hypothetical protein